MGNLVQVVYWGSALKRNEGKIWAKIWFQDKSSLSWIPKEALECESCYRVGPPWGRDPAFCTPTSVTQGATLFGEKWTISKWGGSFWPRTVLVLEIWRRGQLRSNTHRQLGDGAFSNKGNLGGAQTWPIIFTWEMKKGEKKWQVGLWTKWSDRIAKIMPLHWLAGLGHQDILAPGYYY